MFGGKWKQLRNLNAMKSMLRIIWAQSTQVLEETHDPVMRSSKFSWRKLRKKREGIQLERKLIFNQVSQGEKGKSKWGGEGGSGRVVLLQGSYILVYMLVKEHGSFHGKVVNSLKYVWLLMWIVILIQGLSGSNNRQSLPLFPQHKGRHEVRPH